jgi:hypothetical protein
MNTHPNNVRFIYNTDHELPIHEKVIINIFNIVSSIISLPPKLEVVFEDMDDSVYGNTKLDFRFLNRITVNSKLSPKELIQIAIHELIHVHQSHVGTLKVDNYGNFYWHNKMYKNTEDLSYDDYMKLPWEADVSHRHRMVLEEVLKKMK